MQGFSAHAADLIGQRLAAKLRRGCHAKVCPPRWGWRRACQLRWLGAGDCRLDHAADCGVVNEEEWAGAGKRRTVGQVFNLPLLKGRLTTCPTPAVIIP